MGTKWIILEPDLIFFECHLQDSEMDMIKKIYHQLKNRNFQTGNSGSGESDKIIACDIVWEGLTGLLGPALTPMTTP